MTDAVLEAMGEAGVGPDEPVMLAGHSQGGMVAMSVAAAVGTRLHRPRGRDRGVARHPAPAAARASRSATTGTTRTWSRRLDGTPDADRAA